MRTYQLLKVILLVLFAMPGIALSQINLWSQCIDNFQKEPEAAILRNKLPIGGDVTPSMLGLNRKATPVESKALEKFLQRLDDCNDQAGIQKTPRNPDNLYLQLKDGLITFATFSLESIKREIELKQYIESLEKNKKEQAVQNQIINLSCLWDSGPLIGTENQYQINEGAKTLWASRGGIVSDLDFGATLIKFRQGSLFVEISRSTGRFSTRVDNTIFGGMCQLIKERKF